MGQAKRRGTYGERKAVAIAERENRNAQLKELIAAEEQRFESLPPEKQLRTMRQSMSARLMAAALITGIKR